MDQESETVAENHHFLIIKKALQFLIPVSIFSLLYTYCSGFPLLISYYNLQFSTLIFSLLAQALDRKYMFLICNGILAFVINSFKFSSCSRGTLMNNLGSDNDDDEASLLVNVAVAEDRRTTEQGDEDSRNFQEETTMQIEDLETRRDDDDELVTTAELERACSCSSINRCSSTEELNKKIEEFIRKMKEEIRVESQQPLVTVEE